MANGDLVIIAHGAGHILEDSPETPPTDLADVFEEIAYPGSGLLVYGGGSAGCCPVCGEFVFDDRENHPCWTTCRYYSRSSGTKATMPSGRTASSVLSPMRRPAWIPVLMP